MTLESPGHRQLDTTKLLSVEKNLTNSCRLSSSQMRQMRSQRLLHLNKPRRALNNPGHRQLRTPTWLSVEKNLTNSQERLCKVPMRAHASTLSSLKSWASARTATEGTATSRSSRGFLSASTPTGTTTPVTGAGLAIGRTTELKRLRSVVASCRRRRPWYKRAL